MTRTQILKEFTDNIDTFQEYALNIAGADDADDLFQTCSLMLLEFTEDRLIGYYNPTQGLKPFFIRMLCLQYKSATSKFHKDYRKQEQNLKNKTEDIILNAPQSEDESDPAYFDQIKKICKTIYDQAGSIEIAELEKTVWETYVETGSLRKALEAVPESYADLLSLKAVHVIIKKFRRTIKENIF